MFGVDLGHGAFLRDDGDIWAPAMPVPREQLLCDGLMSILGVWPTGGPPQDAVHCVETSPQC